jgi:hypothetical protein
LRPAVAAAYTVVADRGRSVPLTQSAAVSRYRSEALLVPYAALVRRWPVPVQVLLVIAAEWTAFAMAPLLFAGKLI